MLLTIVEEDNFFSHQVHFIQYLSWCLVEIDGRKTTEVKPHCTKVVLACGDTHVG